MSKSGQGYFEAAATIVSSRIAVNGTYSCPCCGSASFSEAGGYEICGICNWEDDPVQETDPMLVGGANSSSLASARENFKNFGHCDGPVKTRILP
jgi:Cysteine-rich CPCC